MDDGVGVGVGVGVGETTPVGVGVGGVAACTALVPKSNTNTTPRPRKSWSLVWNDFTKERLPDGTPVAICNHCQKQLTASSRSGTTHLKNHLKICVSDQVRVDGRKKRRKMLVRRPSDPISSSSALNHDHPRHLPFNPDQTRHDLARMIVMHMYPLAIVDHPGFKNFVRTLQPQFTLAPLEAVKADCLRLYDAEKAKLHEALAKITCRVGLTVDTWRSRGGEYMRLTCHYVDDDWKLQSKILNLVGFQEQLAGETPGTIIFDRLQNWNTHKKLSSVVVDDSPAMGGEVALDLLNLVRGKGALLSNGKLFHLQSCGYILNLIVQDGLGQISELVERTRECMKFVRSLPLVMRKFQEVAEDIHTPEKPVILDLADSWVTTYAMLRTAWDFQSQFMQLAESGSECPHLLSAGEWEEVRAINECLDVFHQLMKTIAAFKNPTTNLYFVEICEIHILLKTWCTSQSPIVVSMSSHMFKRFEEYWGASRTVMAIASVLDPRYKMKSIEYFFKVIYDDEFAANGKIDEVRDDLNNIYNEYVVQSTHTSSSQGLLCYTGSATGGSNAQHVSDGVVKTTSRITLFEARKGLDQYLQESSTTQSIKRDLDMYLEEAVHPSKEGGLDGSFDVLAWWKVNAPKYPILSLMARDILATPLSIVPLDTEGRPLNLFTNSMDSATVQSLVCAHDWLKDEIGGANVDADVCMVPANGDEFCQLQNS